MKTKFILETKGDGFLLSLCVWGELMSLLPVLRHQFPMMYSPGMANLFGMVELGSLPSPACGIAAHSTPVLRRSLWSGDFVGSADPAIEVLVQVLMKVVQHMSWKK